jgi:ferredoxin
MASYANELQTKHPTRVHVYHDDRDERIALRELLDGQPLGTHLYVCGPKGMIGWVCDTAASLGWPREAVHYEEFLAPASGKPFAVKLARSNKLIQVGEHQSLLEAIEAAGVEAPYLCRGGACGQCETDVLESDGAFLHKDHWLTPAQCASGTKIMPCVSRFEGKTTTISPSATPRRRSNASRSRFPKTATCIR